MDPYLPLTKHVFQLAQVAFGLQYLHTRQPPITHGSVNPSHVCIASDGRAMLFDFGLDPLCESIADGLSLTYNPNDSPNYIPAPEVLCPEEGTSIVGRYTPKSDIYDLGSLILEVLSGKKPYLGMSFWKAIRLAMDRQLPTKAQHPGLPAEDSMWALIEQCWSAKPSYRPSANAIVQQVCTAFNPP